MDKATLETVSLLLTKELEKQMVISKRITKEYHDSKSSKDMLLEYCHDRYTQTIGTLEGISIAQNLIVNLLRKL